MTTLTPTQTDVGAKIGDEAGEAFPLLTIAHHPEARFIGERRAFLDEQPFVIGRRGDGFAPGALDDRLISRQHAQIRRAGERLVLEDLGSHNGSYVNGARVGEAELGPGDLVAVGGVVLLVHRGPAFFQRKSHPHIGGVSLAIARVLDQIERAAGSDVTVLIQGETGVGKELVARALHDASGRGGAFVAINCGTVATGVLQSELFGHAKGAFSGAGAERTGLIGSAKGGTLLFDEIGDAPAELQVSLLRLLEQREYRPVGSDKNLQTDARFVAASHVDLRAAVEEGRFRRDLLGRFDRWLIDVPPLRQRREDVLALASGILARRGRPARIERPLALALLAYDWPQNVRELESVVEQILMEQPDGDALALTERITRRLGTSVWGGEETEDDTDDDPAPRMRGRPPTATELRARFVAHGGNVKALAAEFGVGRNTLYRWFKKLGLDPDRLRDGG